MTPKTVTGNLSVAGHPPVVAITMDLPAWDFVLSLIEGDMNNEDETVRIIRDTCQKALVEWLPSVHRSVRPRRGIELKL